MTGPVPLVINIPIKEPEFTRALEIREVKEQHWSGRAGLGGDVQQDSRLHEVLEQRLDLSGLDESDLRYAARRIRTSFPDDPDMAVLASHLESWEMFAAEEAEREMARDMNAMTESAMTRKLIDGLGEDYLREQRTPINRADPKDQHPRTSAPGPYPTGVEPTAEPMSARLRVLAGQVRRLAALSASGYQKNRLSQRAQEIERMSTRAWEREGAVPSNDDEANIRAEANGAQPDDFTSFDDWDDDSRAGSEQRAEDDVALQFDEDIPTMPDVPRAGRRISGEDQLGRPAAGTDEPRGLRRNIHDDNLMQRLGKGSARFGSGQPRGGDRYGGQGKRYSAFGGKESLRESGDLTQYILDDMEVGWFGSHCEPRELK